MLSLLFLILLFLFGIAYFSYGRFISRTLGINDSNPVPSHLMMDGVDYVPTHRLVLFGHHFSSIAGAGPVLGPIIAGVAFGWLPPLLWIVLGSIFIGGLHDFSVLTVSMRHRGESIANIAGIYMGERARRFFMLFVWFALLYVMTVFTDITAETFVKNGGVASSSILYILLALLFGLSLYRLKIPLKLASFIFVPLVFAGIWAGQKVPFVLASKKVWYFILLFYCFFASILPVWVLLQPRDYLSSYLLYASVLMGACGILAGNFEIKSTPFKGFSSPETGSLFPILFITVACGAISGFHSLVASGTSPKQISKESDARFIGYGGMLLEGVVAIIALSGVMVFSEEILKNKDPMQIYSLAMGNFFMKTGLQEDLGKSFGLLAISAFVLTTLDTATRIARYVLQELTGGVQKTNRYLATVASLILPIILLFIKFKDKSGRVIPAWKAIWPVFGTTNQLLAVLAFLTVISWLTREKKRILPAILPAGLMVLTTLTALIILIIRFKFSPVGIISSLLLVLAIFVIVETVRNYFRLKRT